MTRGGCTHYPFSKCDEAIAIAIYKVIAISKVIAKQKSYLYYFSGYEFTIAITIISAKAISIAIVTTIAMTVTIARPEDKTIAKATAEGKIVAKSIAEDTIIAKALGQFNVKNCEQ